MGFCSADRRSPCTTLAIDLQLSPCAVTNTLACGHGTVPSNNAHHTNGQRRPAAMNQAQPPQRRGYSSCRAANP
jgi:hypothetical protein